MSDEQSWRPPTTDAVREVLSSARTVAVVGVSDKPERASHDVTSYLIDHSDYEVWLVNPRLTSLFGRAVYPSLADLPAAPDVVDVFRRHTELAHITDQAIAAHAGTLWFQLGLYDETAASRAASAGLTVIMDRCLKVEHSALLGPAR